jgi:prophage regulatory protein
MDDSFLRLPQVEALSGLKRSSIYNKIKRGEFPRPIRVSENVSGWLHSEVMAWVESRIQEARATGN